MSRLDTLWYSRSPHPGPLGLAAQLGWYLDEFRGDGLRVFTVDDHSDLALRDRQLADHPRSSIRQGSNTMALWQRSRGATSRVVALSWIDEFQGLLSRPGRGIDTPAQLAGRRLALPVTSSPVDASRAEALSGFLAALRHAGMGPPDVEFVDIDADRFVVGPGRGARMGPYGEYARQLSALSRGEVDAIYVKGARGLQAARAAGAWLMFDLRQLPDPLLRVHTGTPRPVVVDEWLLREHPDVVARFLARVVAAGDWAARHPQETVAYLARETRSTEALVREAYGADVHLSLGSTLDPRSVQALQVQMRFLQDWGFISRSVDIPAWLDPRPLQAARDLLARLGGLAEAEDAVGLAET